MKNTLALLAFLCISTTIFSQEHPPHTPSSERVQRLAERKKMPEKSMVAGLPFRSIGPSVFGGRVSDVDVSPTDPTHFFVAYASGGLWKTTNNGQSFSPIFEHEMVMTIGDIAVDWRRNVIWVGTGEVNSSRSSYAGAGMFRSTDGGQTWEHRGLPESHHIGRVVLHPGDPNTVWVAALGHLYSNNPERGVFKTTDGGSTWEQVLFVDEKTGAVDLLLDSQDPNTLYAATWQRERSAWDFDGSGPGSGIWKSVDGGAIWAKLTVENAGFPTGDGAGRIGLATTISEGKTVLFSIIDNQNRRPKEKEEKEPGLAKDDFKNMDREAFLALKNEDLNAYLKDNDFPKKYNAEGVKEQVRKNEIQPKALAEYLDNANTQLFDSPVIGAEVYRSDDGGKSWSKTHSSYLDDVFYSYGYYFGQIRVAPQNSEKLFIFGVPVLISEDGGANWKSINGDNVHVDHHALWVSPEREGHLILGNDGGLNISYDDGDNWVKCNTPPVGQFYYVAVDNQENYRVYGGLQDNGVWHGPHDYEAGNGWHNSGHYPYKSILGGDGMQTAIDSRDNRTIYTGFQFGFYYRMDRETGKSEAITPKHDLGEQPFRWNWQTPIHLSKHNEDILYMGSNMLHRSFDQGENWAAISGDLTKGGKPGNVPYGTLTTVHESPLKFGLLYTGSDDGLIHVSKDAGNTWTLISQNLPQNLWVSRVQASQHAEGRVFASLNGYRWDDFRPFIYMSENYGETWTPIISGLPMEPVNVVKEDSLNPNLLYAGTDNGLYFSLNRGGDFMLANNDLPAVAVHDLVVHPGEHHLIVGTHGRSLYLADIQHVQQLADSILAKPVHAFEIAKLTHNKRWGSMGFTWDEEPMEPEISLPVYVRNGGEIVVRVKAGDVVLMTWETDVKMGMNYLEYRGHVVSGKISMYEKWLNTGKEKQIELEAGENGVYYLNPGRYSIEFDNNGVVSKQDLVVEEKK